MSPAEAGAAGTGTVPEGVPVPDVQTPEEAAPVKTETGYEPTILAFCCNWCSYAGADLAGVSRLQMPANFHVVRVMCSARVKPEWVLKALAEGMDGVIVLGCHIGDCHYISGNHRTKKRIPVIERMLHHIGLEPERLLLDWVSASEGERFQKVITAFVEGVKKVGPNPFRLAGRKKGSSGGGSR